MPVVGGAASTALLVPTGGGPGDVLTKKSSSDGDAGWQTRYTGSGGSPMYVSGGWYSNQTTTSPANGAPVTIGGTCYQPLWLPKPVAISAMAAYGSVGIANTPLFFGVSTMDLLTRLPVNVLGVGSVSPANTSVAMQVAPMQQSVVIPQGWSFLSVGVKDSTSAVIYGSSNTWTYRTFREQCTTSGPGAIPTGTNVTFYVWQMAGTDGSPSQYPTVTAQALNGIAPFTVWLRVA